MDRLRVRDERDTLVFGPGESYSFEVLCDPLGVVDGEEYELAASLASGRAGAVVWESEPAPIRSTGGPAAAAFSVPLPRVEGVYRVVLEARRPSGLSARFFPSGEAPPLARREWQIVVMDPERQPAAPSGWRLAYEYDPRTQRWSERLPEWMRWKRLPWFAEGPLSNVPAARRHANRRNAIELPPALEDGAANWVAYPLPTPRVGSAYTVEVDHLGDDSTPLSLTILEPDALGVLRPSGPAVTVTRPRWNRSESVSTARLAFHPRTTSPLLVVANPAAESIARFGAIRLLETDGAAVAVNTNADQRTVALDWSEADLPHAVGASHRRSADGRYETPDLLTWWETARNVADRVQLAGANAAIVTLSQSGAAWAPSTVWPGVRRDLGVWEDASNDLPRREAFHLLLREFERRDLRLIAAVRFDAATPGLGADTPSADGSDAAEARERAVLEVLDAAQGSPALAGIAVRASASGWAVSHGDAEEGHAVRLSEAYQQLAELVRQHSERNVPLLLLPREALRAPAARDAFRPRLSGATPNDDYGGIAEISQTAIGLRVVRPHGATPPRSPFDFANSDPGLALLRSTLSSRETPAAWSIGGATGRLRLASSGELLRLGPSTDAASDLLAANASIDPTQQQAWLAAAAAAEVDLVVLSGPASAGWQDAATERATRSFVSLPRPRPSDDAAERSAEQEVATRVVVTPASADGPGEATLLVANQAAWPRTTHVTVEVDRRVQAIEEPTASTLEPTAEWLGPGRHVLTLRLDAHATRSRRFVPGAVRVVGVRTEPNPQAQRELAEALAELQGRDTTARRRTGRVRNASFEDLATTEDAERPVGWDCSSGVTPVSGAAIEGERGLRLTASANEPAVAVSEPFAAPATGNLVLGLQARAERMSPDAELILQVETLDERYRRETRLPADRLGDAGADAAWRPIVLPLDDAPLGGEPLRLRLMLRGDGQAVIDDVSTEDVLLPLDAEGLLNLRAEKLAIVGLLTAAESALAEGRLEACRKLVDGHWANYLVDNFPQRVVERAAEPVAEADDQDPEQESGDEPLSVGERLRQYLPRWWQ